MAEGGVGAADRPRVTVERLEDFYRRAFAAVELPAADAATVARVLLAADVRGIDSHGAPQARGYARMIRSGLANPRPQIRTVSALPGMAVLDGDNGLGPVVGDYAMRLAISKASEVGVGTVTVRNSNHYASCFYYPLVAIEAGMAGMTITTSGPLTLPTFGLDPILGHQPLRDRLPRWQRFATVPDRHGDERGRDGQGRDLSPRREDLARWLDLRRGVPADDRSPPPPVT